MTAPTGRPVELGGGFLLHAQCQSWARSIGLAVPDRGRLNPDIWAAWNGAHQSDK